MEFNVDCAIEIMNFIIDNQSLSEDGRLNIFYCKHFYESDKLKKYGNDIIFYALIKLHEGGYIDAVIQHNQSKCRINYIKGLTLRGHELCEHMKSPTISEKVKRGIKEVGRHSLAYVESITKECLVESSKEAVKIAMTGQG